MKKEEKLKNQEMDRFEHYECDGQYRFIDMEMNIEEEHKKQDNK